MDSILSVIFPCITSRERAIQLPVDTSNEPMPSSTAEKSAFINNGNLAPSLTCDEAATRIVDVFFEAEKKTTSLNVYISEIAHEAGGWSEWLADRIRQGIEAALIAGKKMGALMTAAYDKACEAATVFEKFAADHPLATGVFVTVIAIGMLVFLAPYVLELLGFGIEGPIEGKLVLSCNKRLY